MASEPQSVAASLYPARPADIPPDLTRPSPRYQRHTWAAVAGLLGFAALYLGLIVWLARTSWRLVTGTPEPFIGVLLAIPAVFLLAFLVKGLFFVRREESKTALEVRPEAEPELFAFVHRIADEAGAPRPHRVFLTPEVNAAVAYDVSFWNLLVPTRKNLYVGLGLVNVLTLDEMKAVLAHEFGHFAQRTMAVGSWVYVAGQAVGGIVERRDGFDRFLQGLSRVDLRIAWIGWLMRLVVFAIRAVLETAFRGVVVLQRSLSREMEFQADLVSVSLCGSDSLVHALRRLPAADDALDRAAGFASGEARAERPVADLYAVHTRCLEGLRRLRNDPDFGLVPSRPDADPAGHRVFDAHLAETPRMWATHPPSRDREENAKQRYVASVLDGRPAWTLFRDAAATRHAMTAHLLGLNAPELAKHPLAAPEETLARLDAQFAQRASDERYRGVYVGRSVVRWAPTAPDLVGPLPADHGATTAALDALYPATLVGELKALRLAEQHVDQLEALRRGLLQAAGGQLRFEGRVVPRGELPALIERVKGDRDARARRLADHDRAVRTAHRAAAQALGGGWEAHLAGLAALLHCTEHLDAELEDANGFLGNVFAVVTADRNVSSSEMSRLLDAANELHRTVAASYAAGKVLRPPDPAPEGADVAWQTVFEEEFRLNAPSREGFAGNWFQATHTWVTAARNGLGGAAAFALDALLQAEDHVARCFREGTDPGPAPTPATVPAHYATLVPGTERKRQERLDWWDRFLLADGWGPGALRLGVAGAVLAPALFLTAQVGTREVVIHNGLAIPVRVRLGDTEQQVGPGVWERVSVTVDALPVVTTGMDGRPIEAFDAPGGKAYGTAVYNVAGAGFLVEERVGYGMDGGPPSLMGSVRWLDTRADDVFRDPPTTVQADGPTTRGHVFAVTQLSPAQLLGGCPDEPCRVGLATAHLRFDPTAGPDYDDWATALVGNEALAGLVAERVAAAPDDVRLGRLEMDVEVPGACERRLARAAEQPDNADAIYLAGRCRERNGEDTDALFADAAARFPDHPWLGWAAAWAAAEAGDLDGASARLERVRPQLPALADEIGRLQLLLLRARGAALDAQVAVLPEGADRAWLADLLRAEATGDPGLDDDAAPGDLAAAQLAAGRLQEAAHTLDAAHEDAAPLRWLIAGSDGADGALRTRALEQGVEGVTAGTVAVAAALAHLAGQDPGAYLAEVKDPSGAVVPRLAEAAASDDEALLGQVERQCRQRYSQPCTHLTVYAIVRLGDRAPEALRARARADLLPLERPWFR